MHIYFCRDLFIICPAVDMAEFWAANTRSSVHMYHLPEDSAYNRCLSFQKLIIILDFTELMATHIIKSITFNENLCTLNTFFHSADLSVPMDVQYLFGVPLASEMHDLFISKERTLALQIMNYMANFIKSGYLSTFSVVFFFYVM